MPDGVLFGSSKAHKELRRMLVEDQKLDGIVSLPGMMTGQILAGVDPGEAAKYQIMIMFAIGGVTALAVVAAALASLQGRLDWPAVVAAAKPWVQAVRERPAPFWAMESLLREYPISSAEGLALMRLAEALLRVPDAETAIALTADQLGRGDFDSAGAEGSPHKMLAQISAAEPSSVVVTSAPIWNAEKPISPNTEVQGLSTKASRSSASAETFPGDKVRSDDEILHWARQYGGTVWHLIGTCRMGPSTDMLAVVDPTLAVHGVTGLRVVDCSVMPAIVSGNTNAPVIMIAEKAAAMMLEDASLDGDWQVRQLLAGRLNLEDPRQLVILASFEVPLVEGLHRDRACQVT